MITTKHDSNDNVCFDMPENIMGNEMLVTSIFSADNVFKSVCG